MIPYFHALFIQRHGMISALMIYGHSIIYSVQIRDIGRFLAKFNRWTNTFGNRLVMSQCLRIHPSVKLSKPILYTCNFIVAVSLKIAL